MTPERLQAYANRQNLFLKTAMLTPTDERDVKLSIALAAFALDARELPRYSNAEVEEYMCTHEFDPIWVRADELTALAKKHGIDDD